MYGHLYARRRRWHDADLILFGSFLGTTVLLLAMIFQEMLKAAHDL
jgi:hypothetical protein